MSIVGKASFEYQKDATDFQLLEVMVKLVTIAMPLTPEIQLQLAGLAHYVEMSIE